MIKYLSSGLLTLCLFNIAAFAGDNAGPGKHKEEVGFGIGAIIGGLIAGPPGAIIGAASGVWFGNKEEEEDKKLAGLNARLQDKQVEFAHLQKQFADLQSAYGRQVQKVNLESRLFSLDELSRGISLAVYFRTDSAEIDPEIIPRIERLAEYLKDFPEIKLYLEAHADRRGKLDHNKALSRKRAASVEKALIETGFPENRIRTHSYGETQALAPEGDLEGYVFDRRVDIQLILKAET